MSRLARQQDCPCFGRGSRCLPTALWRACLNISIGIEQFATLLTLLSLRLSRNACLVRVVLNRHGGTITQLFVDQAKHLPEYERFKQLSGELQAQMAAGAYLEDMEFFMSAWRLEPLNRLEFVLDTKGGERRGQARVRFEHGPVLLSGARP